MAYEAGVVELYGQNNSGDKRRHACLDATAITKGALCTLSDPRTAAKCNATGDYFAGIAAMDKEALDGALSISLWENGVFDLSCSGAVQVGNYVKMASNNQVIAATPADLTSSRAIIVGIALEQATDGEVINVRVNN